MRHTLTNGLTVVLQPNHAAPVISLWVWYRVGSRHEREGGTGLSHWVEHMLFKGTRRFPAAQAERTIARDGGLRNAMTWLDWTAFYATLPAEKIDYALHLEADRMHNLRFGPAAVSAERAVIVAEREGYENSPLFRLTEEMQHLAFRVHPYRHEVIGDMADLNSLSRADLQRHYRHFYTPNNAALVLVGDFKPKAMLAQVRALFESLPARPVPTSQPRPEPTARGERRAHLHGEGETAYVQVGYRVPAATHPDFFPLVALDSVLAGASSMNMFGSGGTSNRTSRLHQALVQTGLSAGFGGGLSVTVDPFLYLLTATVSAGQSPAALEAALLAEIDRVRAEPITEAELRKAIRQAQAMFAYSAESVTNQGFWLGINEILGQPRWFQHYLDKLAKVTVAEVQRVAQTYLTPQNRVVGIFEPDHAQN